VRQRVEEKKSIACSTDELKHSSFTGQLLKPHIKEKDPKIFQFLLTVT
jgi:hypothetical protein